MDDGTPLLRADGLTRHYSMGRSGSRLWRRSDDSRPTVTAIADISITLDRGEVVGIAGPSGSGKSTLLHVLAGLELPDEGTVTVDGVDLTALSARARRRHRLERVGIVFQRFHLLDAYTARTNVALPLVELGWSKARRRERAETVLESVGLGDRLHHRPGQLSGGEQQRVAIARALVTKPDLVVADEPTGELDSEAGDRVVEELRQIATDRAVVLASHDRRTLEAADRLVALRDGRRVEPEEVLQTGTVP